MKEETINLNEGMKLVSFVSKNGIYVYQDKKLVGVVTVSRILNTMDV